jgi:hypothetical protein
MTRIVSLQHRFVAVASAVLGTPAALSGVGRSLVGPFDFKPVVDYIEGIGEGIEDGPKGSYIFDRIESHDISPHRH